MKILLVEDNRAFRKALCEALADHTVYEADSAEQAVGLLLRLTSVDVVITDLYLPGEDGVSLLRWVRHYQPSVKIVLCSGIDDQTSEIFDACLSKPVEIKDLHECLQKLWPH